MIQPSNFPQTANYPLLVGSRIQGASITFQGSQQRSPVTFQGLGQLFPEGSFTLPTPVFPPGVINRVAESPLPDGAAPAASTSKQLLLVGSIVGGAALIAFLLFRR